MAKLYLKDGNNPKILDTFDSSKLKHELEQVHLLNKEMHFTADYHIEDENGNRITSAKEWTPSKGVGWKPPTPKDVASLPKPTGNQKTAGGHDYPAPPEHQRKNPPLTISPTESQEKTGWRKSKKSWRKRKAKASHVVRDKQGNVKLSLEPEDISRERHAKEVNLTAVRVEMDNMRRYKGINLQNMRDDGIQTGIRSPESIFKFVNWSNKVRGKVDVQSAFNGQNPTVLRQLLKAWLANDPSIRKYGEAKHPITGKRIRSFKFTCPYCHMEMRNTEYAQHAVDFHRDQISYLRGEHHQLGIMGELKNDIREMHSKLLSMSESMNGLHKQGDESEEPDQKAGFIREFDRLKTGYGITERRYKQAIREYKKLHEKGMEDQQRSKWLLENTAKISIIESITERQKILDERKKSKMSPDDASARAKKAWQSRQRAKQDAGQQRSQDIGHPMFPQNDLWSQRSKKLKTKTKSKRWSNIKKRSGAWWQSMKPDQKEKLLDTIDVSPTTLKAGNYGGGKQFTKQDMKHLDFHEMKQGLQTKIVQAYQGLRQNARHDRDRAIDSWSNLTQQYGHKEHAEIWREESQHAGHPISMKMAAKYTKMDWNRLPRKIKRHYTHSMYDSWNRGTVLPVKKIQKRWQGL